MSEVCEIFKASCFNGEFVADLWEKLLEMRIKLQKGLQLSNQYPQHEHLSSFRKAGSGNIPMMQGQARVTLVTALEKLLTLQAGLFSSNSDTSAVLTGEFKKIKEDSSDEEIPSDTDDEDAPKEKGSCDTENIPEVAEKELKLPSKRKASLNIEDLEEEVCKRHNRFKDYRDATITKWDQKTKLGSGKFKSKGFSSFDRSVMTQVNQIMADKDRLVKRTQLKRSTYRTLGKPIKDQHESTESMEEADSHLKSFDSEIFDDDDFYHQLLKEFIERKTSATNSDDPIEMGRQWLEVQKLRKKIKRKVVDTKASKGRRIRYNVHSKLVNFMAPTPSGSMNDQSKNDLFRSLFGDRHSEGIR